jgi:hypothetical protein
MTHIKDTTLSLQLTLFIDGQLDAAEHARIAQLIESDVDIRNRYVQLCRLRDSLAAREPIPANPWLTERMANHIRREKESDSDLLPVPRRFKPVTAAAFGLMLIAIVALAWIQRDHLLRYVSDTGTQVQLAYEDSILKGWIMPLFQRTSQDQVLEFAMFGTLPLDTEDGTVLRVDENTDRGFRVELASSPSRPRPAATVAELYDEIRPTELQRKVFDTLFLYAQRQLESAVLMNHEQEIAVNPSIGRFNTVLLSGIASSLGPEQLVRFEQFLDRRNTPYTFVAHRSGVKAPPPPPGRVLERFRSVRPSEEFVVLTEDSFTVVRLGLNMDSLRRLMRHLEHRMPRFEVRIQDLAKSYAVSRQPEVPAPPRSPRGISVSPVAISEGGHAISISIEASGEFMQELEREFVDLRREIVVLRRESELLRDDALLRVGEELRRRAVAPPPIPGTPNQRVQITFSRDGIDSLLRDTEIERLLPKDELERLRFELLEDNSPVRRESDRSQQRPGVIVIPAPTPPSAFPTPPTPSPKTPNPPVIKDSSIEI